METNERPWSRAYWSGVADARPLALFRICFGVVVALDLADRLPALTALWGEGVFPRAAFLRSHTVPWQWSLLAVSDRPELLYLSWAVGLAAALAFVAGFRTRAANLVLLVLEVSLQNRNLSAGDGADAVIRTLLVWSLFTDAGAVWSLDARRDGARRWVAAFPVRLLQLQLVLVYLTTAIVKLGAESWRSGGVLYRVYQLGAMTRPLGRWLSHSPGACAALTWAALALELGICLLICLPPARIHRALAIAASLILHGGIFLTMRVGLFCFVMPAAMTIFCAPSWFGPSPNPIEPRRFEPLPAALLGAQMAVVMVVLALLDSAPRPLRAEVGALALSQRWRMFAPKPAQLDVEGRARAVFADGSTGDAFAALPRAPYLSTDRWYLTRQALGMEANEMLRRSFGRYLCARLDGAQTIYFYSHVRPTRAAGEPETESYDDGIYALSCEPSELAVLFAMSDVSTGDARALRWFRAAVAALLLTDLASRLGSFHAFYTDGGVAPRWLASLAGGGWSLLYASGIPASAWLVLGALAALALGLGWRARAASLVSWAVIVSLAHRVPFTAGPFELGLASLALWLACSPPGFGLWPLRAQALLIVADAIARRGGGGSWLVALGCLPLFVSLSRPRPPALAAAIVVALLGLAPPPLLSPLGLERAPIQRGEPPRWRALAGSSEPALPEKLRGAGFLDGARWRNLAFALERSEPLRLGLADYLCRATQPSGDLTLESGSRRFGPYRCLSSDSRSVP